MSSHLVARGEAGVKTFTLIHVCDAFEEMYVTVLREGREPADVRGPYERTAVRSKVYYAAYGDFFEAVRNCNAWLNEIPIEDRPTMEPPA